MADSSLVEMLKARRAHLIQSNEFGQVYIMNEHLMIKRRIEEVKEIGVALKSIDPTWRESE